MLCRRRRRWLWRVSGNVFSYLSHTISAAMQHACFIAKHHPRLSAQRRNRFFFFWFLRIFISLANADFFSHNCRSLCPICFIRSERSSRSCARCFQLFRGISVVRAAVHILCAEICTRTMEKSRPYTQARTHEKHAQQLNCFVRMKYLYRECKCACICSIMCALGPGNIIRSWVLPVYGKHFAIEFFSATTKNTSRIQHFGVVIAVDCVLHSRRRRRRRRRRIISMSRTCARRMFCCSIDWSMLYS